MNDKIPKEIIDILKATPLKEKEKSTPFKMPVNPNLWSDHKILIRGLKEDKK